MERTLLLLVEVRRYLKATDFNRFQTPRSLFYTISQGRKHTDTCQTLDVDTLWSVRETYCFGRGQRLAEVRGGETMQTP